MDLAADTRDERTGKGEDGISGCQQRIDYGGEEAHFPAEMKNEEV